MTCCSNRPWHDFFNFWLETVSENPWHGWNERLKISKCVKFESDLLKTNEYIAFKSRGIFQAFVLLTCTNCSLTNVCKMLRLQWRNIFARFIDVSLSSGCSLVETKVSCTAREKVLEIWSIWLLKYVRKSLRKRVVIWPGSENRQMWKYATRIKEIGRESDHLPDSCHGNNSPPKPVPGSMDECGGKFWREEDIFLRGNKSIENWLSVI